MKATIPQFSNVKFVVCFFLLSNFLGNSLFCQITKKNTDRVSQPRVVSSKDTAHSQKPVIIPVDSKEIFRKKLNGLNFPQSTISKLENKGITSLGEFRKALAFTPNKLSGLSDAEKGNLKKASILSLISNDDTLNKTLIKSDFKTLKDLNKYSVNDLVNKSKGRLSKAQAIQYKKYAVGLNNIVSLGQYQYAKSLVNPSQLYKNINSPIIDDNSLKQAISDPNNCIQCEEGNDLFSPAVYLLYLLDFIEGSFGKEYNTLEQINKKFFQKFGDIPVYKDNMQTCNYIQFANNILETYYWQQIKKEREFINDTLTNLKETIYSYFNKENIKAYMPHPDVLYELYINLMRELDLDKSEVDFTIKGSEKFKKNFAKKKGIYLSTLEEIKKNYDDGEVKYKEVFALKDTLLAFYYRKYWEIVKQEKISDLEDELSKEFSAYYRKIKKDSCEGIAHQMIDKLPEDLYNQNNQDRLDDTIARLKGNAGACVVLGYDCPSGSFYKGNPINPIWELYRHYYKLYDKNEPQPISFANTKYKNLYENIKWERFDVITKDLDLTKLTHLDSVKIKIDTSQYVKEKINSEEEFDKQIHLLANIRFNNEIIFEDIKKAFNYEVKRRAKEEWQSAVSKAEMGYHKKIRDNILSLILKKNITNDLSVNKNIALLADSLFIDLSVDETYRTTPLSISINRIQSFVQAAQLGIITTDLSEFNKKTWNWLSSYGIWHAAMMVSLYPENFLMPELRNNQTQQFTNVIDSISASNSINYDEFRHLYLKNLIKLESLDLIGVINIENDIYLFARSKDGIYYSILKYNNLWKPWEKIECLSYPNLDSFLKIFIGYQNVPNDYSKFLHLLSFKSETIPNEYKLCYATLKINKEGFVDCSGGWKEIQEDITYPSYFDINTLYFFNTNDVFGLRYVNGGMERSWGLQFDEKGHLYNIAQGEHSNNFYQSVSRVVNDWSGKVTLWCKGSDCDEAYLSTSYEIWQKIPGINRIYGTLALSEYNKNDNSILLGYRTSYTSGLKIQKLINNDLITLDSISYGSSIRYPESIILKNQDILILGMDANTIQFVPLNSQFKFSSKQPLYLSLGGYSENMDSYGIQRQYKDISKESPARVYLDEYNLLLPLYIADFQNRMQQYSEAILTLSTIYNIKAANEKDREKYPAFNENDTTYHKDGKWLEDPFNPYIFAGIDKHNYLVNVIFAHVENLLDWADHLFTMDNPESVNRARELYELADKILEMNDWPADSCSVTSTFFKSVYIPGHRVYPPYITDQIRRIDITKGSNTFKQMKVEAVIRRYDDQIQTLQPMLDRDRRFELQSKKFEDDFLSRLDYGLFPGFSQRELDTTYVDIGAEIPEIKPFCLPINSKLYYYRWRIESNLEKIRTNRNFAGIQRDLQLYSIPLDPEKMVKAAAAGELDFENVVPSSPPPVYRYSFLVERAKYLVSCAQQFENSMLSSMINMDQESYSLLKAQQDIKLEKSNVNLQSLNLVEAKDNRKQADKQLSKTYDIYTHYDDLINEGLISNETSQLYHLNNAWEGANFAVISGAIDVFSSRSLSPMIQAGINLDQISAQIDAINASFERREQEWKFQRDLAKNDIDIANLGIDIADDKIDIVNQEKAISELRLEFANDNIEFLNSKFTNKELYKWMSKNLQKLYKEQLNIAIATAKAAQRALEFELQTPLDFIGYEYWDSEKKDLLGAEKLLADINKMEQYRLNVATRKKEIEKTISLANIAPAEFEQFRKTGVLNFGTPESWFDRDFPGHYLRMIKNVSISVLALVPPNEGIHATLSNPGISRIMTGAPFKEPSIIQRLPESVSLSQTTNATGLFELKLDDPMLLPFEGSGVATNWMLEMPKGANRFDYSSIADILFTIRYTALEDRIYRQNILNDMGQDEMGYVKTSSNRYFSIANEFPDQWYSYHNPTMGLDSSSYIYPMSATYEELEQSEKQLEPYSMVIDLRKKDFVPNEENRKIKRVTIVMRKSDDLFWEDGYKLPLKLKFIPEKGYGTDIENIEIDNFYESIEAFNGKSPYGKWIIQLDYKNKSTSGGLLFPNYTGTIPNISWLKDLLLVIEYKADVHYNK